MPITQMKCLVSYEFDINIVSIIPWGRSQFVPLNKEVCVNDLLLALEC